MDASLIFLPDTDDFAEVHVNSSDLSDENSSDCFVESCTIHVYRGTDRNNESRYPRIITHVVQYLKSDGKRGGTVKRK